MPYHTDCIAVFQVRKRKACKAREPKETAAKYENKDIWEKKTCKTRGPNEYGCKIREQRHTAKNTFKIKKPLLSETQTSP
jgi:hypothetical protein